MYVKQWACSARPDRGGAYSTWIPKVGRDIRRGLVLVGDARENQRSLARATDATRPMLPLYVTDVTR